MIRRKPKGITARLRASKRRRLDKAETAIMREVRERDARPRFLHDTISKDYWGCADYLPFETSHSAHRGMGGDATGKRTQRQTMVLLSRKRHTGHKFSVDRGGLKWTPVDAEKGSDGPIQWWLNAGFLPLPYRQERGICFDHWILLATETAPHDYLPLTTEQRELFSMIA